MTQFYEQVRDRLIRYAKVDTQSSNHSDTVPTTMKQFDLARLLEAELSPGETLDLDADIIPSYADDLSILWGSGYAKIATVNSDGLVSALTPGQCTITAMSANGRKDVCSLTVK